MSSGSPTAAAVRRVRQRFLDAAYGTQETRAAQKEEAKRDWMIHHYPVIAQRFNKEVVNPGTIWKPMTGAPSLQQAVFEIQYYPAQHPLATPAEARGFTRFALMEALQSVSEGNHVIVGQSCFDDKYYAAHYRVSIVCEPEAKSDPAPLPIKRVQGRMEIKDEEGGS
jgi:hypothetical protein